MSVSVHVRVYVYVYVYVSRMCTGHRDSAKWDVLKSFYFFFFGSWYKGTNMYKEQVEAAKNDGDDEEESEGASLDMPDDWYVICAYSICNFTTEL